MLTIVEIVLTFLAVLFIVTQLTIPALRNTSLFPLFRKESRQRAELVALEQSVVEQALDLELQAKRQLINSSEKGSS